MLRHIARTILRALTAQADDLAHAWLVRRGATLGPVPLTAPVAGAVRPGESVSCPTCARPPGQPCVATRGKYLGGAIGESHPARVLYEVARRGDIAEANRRSAELTRREDEAEARRTEVQP